MIKGIRKNVFVMKCGRDSPFESATFVLKEGASVGEINRDIVAEAERLVGDVFSECRPEASSKKQKKKKTK